MKRRVLIAENDQNYLISIAFFMEDLGFEVYRLLGEENMIDDLAHFAEQKRSVDILISGLSSSEGGNRRICRQARSIFPKISILMLTSNHDRMLRFDFLNVYLDDILTKPFEPDELRKKIAIILEKRNMLNKNRIFPPLKKDTLPVKTVKLYL